MIVLAALALYALALVVLTAVGGDARGAWDALLVPALEQPFADLRLVLGSVACAGEGVDVYQDGNPCDPYGRRFNYPPTWLLLGRLLPIGPSATVALGIVTAGLFALAAVVVLGRLRPAEQAVATAAVVSPSLMLGVERGNTDLLMFALAVLALRLLAARTRPGRAGALAAIAAAAALKLYPAALVLVIPPRRPPLVLVGALVGVGALGLHAVAGIWGILDHVPGGGALAYGHTMLFHLIDGAWEHRLGLGDLDLGDGALPPLVLLAALIGARHVGRRLSGPGGDGAPGADDDPFADAAFFAGAVVFLGTFATGSHHDYRLVFLLLCLPRLFAVRRSCSVVGGWAAACAGAIVATLWVSRFSEKLLGLDEALNWALVVGLCAVETASRRGTAGASPSRAPISARVFGLPALRRGVGHNSRPAGVK